ncbi:unnamed protein product [Caenorhabditis angaria]|uniref:Peptidase M13 C-terminal domain-containing protein n=1 Tax=Caenorhabditis angaria TaxID=860376 RepID=A0A9P1J3Q9_9PELO|nr:unnamed protein product [Caenorhabditis angaria]
MNLSKIKIFWLLFLIKFAEANILYDVLKQRTGDPCENLYRHTCPLGVNRTISQELEKSINPILQKFDETQDAVRKTYSFLKIDNIQRIIESAIESMTFIKICEKFNLTKGVQYLENILEQTKKVMIEDIKNTNWLLKHNQTDIAIRVIEKIYLTFDSKNQEKVKFFFKDFENCFNSCLKDFPNSTEVCVTHGYECAAKHNFTWIDLIKTANGVNEHNKIINFGISFILYASQTQDEVLKVALIASLMAHELSHTMMNSITASNDNILSYFPPKAEDCITKQYESTCKTYKEIKCFMTFRQLEEAGADVIGMNLAYKLFKNIINQSASESILKKLNLSNIDQLFFLTYWSILCRPEKITTTEMKDHPANNIRINAVVQLPEFQKSFNCSADSTMMKSRTDQCLIYGKKSKFK